VKCTLRPLFWRTGPISCCPISAPGVGALASSVWARRIGNVGRVGMDWKKGEMSVLKEPPDAWTVEDIVVEDGGGWKPKT